MNHRYLTGKVYHRRFLPKKHFFQYQFFMIDIDLKHFSSLKSRFFGINTKNIFSFQTKDHFGKSPIFLENVKDLLEKLELKFYDDMRFITLPRIFHFVFNPISLLLALDHLQKPVYLVAEVHNYNGGRVLYPVMLQHQKNDLYKGIIPKSMYVSPFFDHSGNYQFLVRYNQSGLNCQVSLFHDQQKMLDAVFNGQSLPFGCKNTLKLFSQYTFTTFLIVIRTVWQTVLLKMKGLRWYSPLESDQKKQY